MQLETCYRASCKQIEGSLQEQIKSFQERLEIAYKALCKIAESAEDHPLYMPFVETLEEVDEIGGDAAFITADIAWTARQALKEIE